MVRPAIVLYGATGYTGRLIARRAMKLGLPIRLGGRDGAALKQLSAELGYEQCQADLDDTRALTRLVRGARVLLNAAGPFVKTAGPLMNVCLALGVSYIDLSGEVDTLAQAASLDHAARAARLMLMPAVGFDVVPSDCLATLLVEQVPDASSLVIAVSGLRHVSRGSARTMLNLIGRPVRVRRKGELVPVPPTESNSVVDFGNGARAVSAVDWADIVTAYYTTAVPNISVFFETSTLLRFALALRGERTRFLRQRVFSQCMGAMVAALPDGPDERAQASSRCVVHASVLGQRGERASVRCETGDVYAFTAESACEVASRALAGDLEYGFQTPARVYGSDLLRGFSGVAVTETSWT